MDFVPRAWDTTTLLVASQSIAQRLLVYVRKRATLRCSIFYSIYFHIIRVIVRYSQSVPLSYYPD